MDKKISSKYIIMLSALVCFLILQMPALNIENSHWHGFDNSTWSVLEEVEVATPSVHPGYPIDLTSVVRKIGHPASGEPLPQIFLIFSFLFLPPRIDCCHFIRPPPLYHF